jgi:hypothetical protein
MEQTLTRTKFLVTLSKTGNQWKSDKQFKKIMQRMEQGKNLKKKEFDKFWSILQKNSKLTN